MFEKKMYVILIVFVLCNQGMAHKVKTISNDIMMHLNECAGWIEIKHTGVSDKPISPVFIVCKNDSVIRGRELNHHSIEINSIQMDSLSDLLKTIHNSKKCDNSQAFGTFTFIYNQRKDGQKIKCTLAPNESVNLTKRIMLILHNYNTEPLETLLVRVGTLKRVE